MKKFYILLAFSLISICSFAQPTEVQVVDSLFADWNKADVPGGAVGIVKDGELIFAKGYGLADLEHDIEITPSSVFYIGSVSKQFVTFSILLLEEQGKLDLDDRIQKYLPDFPEYDAPLTIRHFIHHTSGVRDYLSLMYLSGKNYLDHSEEAEVYELIKRQKELNFTPGEKFLYSNSCYFMLAMIVEKAAGQSLREFAHQNIFEPLGMNNTLFYDDNTDLIKNRVFSYEKKDNEDGFDNLIMRFDLVGSGGIYSTVEDLYLWDQNFYNNSLGKGGQEIIAKMHEEGVLNNGESAGYAFALNNGTYKGLKTVSHGGSLAGYRAQLLRFPDEEFSVIILANRSDANPTRKAYQAADIFLGDKLKEKPEEMTAQSDSLRNSDAAKKFSQDQLAGSYELQAGVALEVSLEGDTLQVVQSWNQSAYPIVLTKGSTYEIPGEPSVQFVFSDLQDDATQVLKVFQEGNETIFKRRNKQDISEIDLSAYTGNYYSEELDVTYSLFVEEEKLWGRLTSYDPIELKVYDRNTFVTDGNLVRFHNEDGKIKGFELDAGRVTNLKFVKI